MNYIGREFISSDGYKCKIIEDMEVNSNKSPSYRKYRVEFEDGTQGIFSYITLRAGSFNAVPIEFITNNIKINNLYNCTCSLCNYKSYLTVDEMVEHLKRRHNLYNEVIE